MLEKEKSEIFFMNRFIKQKRTGFPVLSTD